ncbi:hypothetical protein GJV44_00642 [Candidatus Vallotia cooleyia]|nr:hypothetical protein GJV44_00642 [Candidatus Vallotia cooleyia]
MVAATCDTASKIAYILSLLYKSGSVFPAVEIQRDNYHIATKIF